MNKELKPKIRKSQEKKYTEIDNISSVKMKEKAKPIHANNKVKEAKSAGQNMI